MQRITGANTIDLGGGKLGFRDRNLGAGLAGTKVLAAWLNNVQEEVARTIELAGISLDGSTSEQLFRAVCRLGVGKGGNFSAGTHNLTADDMGFAFVSAVMGATVINLPPANATGRPMEVTLTRWEAANSVTVNATGGDQLEYVTNGSLTIPPLERVTLRSNGLDAWVVVAETVRDRLVTNSYFRFRLPGGLLVQGADFFTSDAGDVAVAFPQSFAAANSYRLLIGHNSNNTLGSVGSVTRSGGGFDGASHAPSGRTVASCSYIAIGV